MVALSFGMARPEESYDVRIVNGNCFPIEDKILLGCGSSKDSIT